MDWSSFEPKRETHELLPADGEEVVFPGKGCRLVLRTTSVSASFDTDTKRRLNRVAATLADSGAEGIGWAELPGRHPLRDHGDVRAPVYVEGTNPSEVTTTLARAILTAKPDTLAQVKALGCYAMMEW